MSDISGSTSQAENEDEGEGVKKCKWELDDGQWRVGCLMLTDSALQASNRSEDGQRTR